MWPRLYCVRHPAKELLEGYAAKGCPVDCGPAWSHHHITHALHHEPHQSARSSAAVAALHAETEQKLRDGYAKTVRWGDIKDNIPPNLKISPVACIPHKSKAFRVILDLSFSFRVNGADLPSVNDSTRAQAPHEAMAQLGRCLKRMIAVMAQNRSVSKPFRFCKLDIKDGFWRLVVNPADAWNFAYVLPAKNKTQTNIDDTILVVPTSLQMGWAESPPYFCAASETARDTIQELLPVSDTLPPHRLEQRMLPTTIITADGCNTNDVDLVEVFVDDFIGMSNSTDATHLLHFSRAMLHGVHSIFPPPTVTGHTGGDSIAEKKIDKGEGVWDSTKEILGWVFDGQAFTIQLPPSKSLKISKLIKRILQRATCPLKRFQELAGKLQHASLGLPGGAGLFSPLQMAMRGLPKLIIIDHYLQVALADWRTIIQHLSSTPTPVHHLVPDYPDYVGYSDACRLGMGGVWCSGLQPLSPFVWQVEFPTNIQQALITTDNPSGTITINDLELAALVAQYLALHHSNTPIGDCHLASFCDNTSAVAWATKMRTSKSVPAARLLRYLGLLQLANQTSSLSPISIPGKANDMTDISSRAFKSGKFFADHTHVASYFNKHFPFPRHTLGWC